MAVPLSTVEGLPYLGGNSPGFVSVDSSGLQRLKKSKLDAVADPTTLDDSGAGYAVGSRWVNTASGKVFELVDSSPLAAVWKDLTPLPDEIQISHDGTRGTINCVDGVLRLRSNGSTVSDYLEVNTNNSGTGVALVAAGGAGNLNLQAGGSGYVNLVGQFVHVTKGTGNYQGFVEEAADTISVKRGYGGGTGYGDLIGRYIAGNGGLCLGAADNTYGLFPYGSGNIGIRQGSLSLTQYWASTGTQGLRIKSGALFGWSDNATDASYGFDTALSRNAAGVVEVNNGTAGQYRDLILRNLRVASAVTPTLLSNESFAIGSYYSRFTSDGGGLTGLSIENTNANKSWHFWTAASSGSGGATSGQLGIGATVAGVNAGSANASIIIDESLVAGETRFLLYDVDSAQLQRVLVGANGTGPGGVGRALYLAAA